MNAMGTLFSYSLSSGIFLLFGFLAYRLLMAGEKQPALNRAALLGLYAVSLAASPAMSFLDSPSHVPAIAVPAINFGEITIEADPAAEPSASPLRGLLWLYIAGVVATLLYSAIGLIRLALIIRGGRHEARDGYTLVILPQDCVPFSFARYIVMGEKDALRDDSMITTHELGHIRHRHWLDLLLAQGVCSLMWYNPAAWLTRRELRRVHEYQADSAVIDRGVNLREYQMLLIEKAAGVRLQSIANSLDHSNLSKRITMMYKQKNRASRRLRALALAPALFLAAVAVDSPAVASALSAASETTLTQANPKEAPQRKTAAAKPSGKQVKTVGKTAARKATPASERKITEKSDEPQNAVAVMPEYPGGITELMKYLAMNIIYPEAAVKANAQGRVVVKFVVRADGSVADPEIIRGQTPELDTEALRVVAAMPAWTPGKNEKGEPVSCYFTVPINFSLTGGETDNDAAKTSASQKQTTTTTTTTTTVTDGKVSTVSQTRTGENHYKMTMDRMSLESDPAERSVKVNDPKYAPGAADAPAYFVNGKPFTGSLDNISPDQIRSITVKKDDPAYPNGQVMIELK